MKVSFYIIAYNQSSFIERAISGALNQTYSPLEIIISDDCSSDDTWDKIQCAVRNYSGPHKLIIRRNERNLGIADHINAIWHVCSGDWIVASAGDDTSHPNRVARVVEIARHSPKTMLVQSILTEVDNDGNFICLNLLGHDELKHRTIKYFSLEDRLKNESYLPHGAAMAYSKEIIKFFSDLPSDVIFEDNVLNLRAELLGNAALIIDPLVNHTNHSGQITGQAGVTPDLREKRRILRLNSDVSSSRKNIADIILAFENARISFELYLQLISLFEKRARYFVTRRDAVLKRWPFRLVNFIKLLSYGRQFAAISRDELLRSAVPYPVYRYLRELHG